MVTVKISLFSAVLISTIALTACGPDAPDAASSGAKPPSEVEAGVTTTIATVPPNGEVITTSRRARKTSAGYDLTHLFVGSEGTLGVITELTLRVFGIPEVIAAATMQFPSLRSAVDGVIEVIQYGIGVARIELLDSDAVQAVNKYSDTNLPEQTLLLMEFHGSAESTAIDIAATREVLERHGGSGFVQTTDEAERRKLWQARHDTSLACRSLVKNAKNFATDVCVPISRLADCVEATQQDLAETRLIAPIVGHVGDGNFHLTLLCNMEDADEIERCRLFLHRLVERSLAMEGTCTGEHGSGVGKIDYLVDELGISAVSTMAAVKSALDPNGIMNPGKIFERR